MEPPKESPFCPHCNEYMTHDAFVDHVCSTKRMRYAAWGIDKSYRYKWMANFAQWCKWGPYGGGWRDFIRVILNK